jgi:aldehyde dehydrogenase (NAD+)
MLENLLAVYEKRSADMAKAISMEVGAPITMSTQQQVGAGTGHIKSFIRTLKNFEFEAPLHEKVRSEHIVLEPIGVCGLITPWNWPMNQICAEGGAGRGCRVHLHSEAVGNLAAQRHPVCRDDARGRLPGRRVQPGQRRRSDRG